MEIKRYIPKTVKAPRLFRSALLLTTLALAACGDTTIPTYPSKTDVTPTPTSNVLPSITPIPTPDLPINTPSTIQDVQIQPGQCVQAEAGDTLQGDVYINGVWVTDREATSGQIIVFQAGGRVCAPYGADLQKNVMGQSGGKDILTQDIAQMKSNGCELRRGCSIVLVNYYPSGLTVTP